MNQDSLFVCETPIGNLSNIFVVADGMGGHSAGDYASACTVKTIEREVMLSEDKEPVRILKNAIETANDEVFNKAVSDPKYKGMGTTTVCGTIYKDVLYVANVGDSRLYLINDMMNQITKDHSLVEEMVRAGELEEEEARNHPDKNIITRAIGVTGKLDIDFFEVDLRKGDLILLCSDGLTNMVGDDDILRIVRESGSIDESVEELIKVANRNGGKDNITVVIVDPFYNEVNSK
ncbi:MAG: Stp1/IreP family PP2C-type Ser/Thr phosphatase [Lachnospiraceae bacterium]|nr:Stp1/IreP family PP2C-type Ser/Thr phosphatase [Lachnospiraceae bacterium]